MNISDGIIDSLSIGFDDVSSSLEGRYLISKEEEVCCLIDSVTSIDFHGVISEGMIRGAVGLGFGVFLVLRVDGDIEESRHSLIGDFREKSGRICGGV